MSSASVAELVVAAQRGDRDAFATLYERHARLVHAVLLGYVAADDAPDLVQDVFLTALRELAALRDGRAFPGWIASIARNRARMHRRAARPHVVLDDQVRAPGAAPDDAVEARLDAERVLEAIRALPEKLRAPLLLRLVEGLGGEEIAAQTGLSHAAVRVYLHRGLRALRERLAASEPVP